MELGKRYKLVRDSYGYQAGTILTPTSPSQTDAQVPIRGKIDHKMVMMSLLTNVKTAGLFVNEQDLEEQAA